MILAMIAKRFDLPYFEGMDNTIERANAYYCRCKL